MKVTTRRKYNSTPAEIWPLLFNSKMDEKQPCYLLFGLPKPLECKLEGDEGGKGKTRECVSDKGIIKQNILEWDPGRTLSFKLVKTDIYFGPCIDSIVETFHIKDQGHNKSVLVRETVFKIKTPYHVFLFLPMFIGLKSIHRYVFKNWERILNEMD